MQVFGDEINRSFVEEEKEKTSRYQLPDNPVFDVISRLRSEVKLALRLFLRLLCSASIWWC